jgi:hypothetical protein
VIRPFNLFNQLRDAVVTQSGRQPQLARLDDKRFRVRVSTPSGPSQADHAIHGFLPGNTETPHLLIDKPLNIFIESQSRAHIMMLSGDAS